MAWLMALTSARQRGHIAAVEFNLRDQGHQRASGGRRRRKPCEDLDYLFGE